VATLGKCCHCGGTADEDSFVCQSCWETATELYSPTDGEAAISTTSVMQATVCPTCGHKFDGKKNASLGADGKACRCKCHGD
jgi:hypothetical protein